MGCNAHYFIFCSLSLTSYAATDNGTQLTEAQLKQMADVQKRLVNQLVFYFFPIGADGNTIWGNPKYTFNVPVIDGVFYAKRGGIEVGRYVVNAYAASKNGGWAFSDEQIPLEIKANQKSTLSVNFKLFGSTLIPVRIEVAGASFDEGNSYQITLPYDQQGFSQAETNAVYNQGYLNFLVWAYQPYSTAGRVAISITDKFGNTYNNTYSINMMDVVKNNWQPITPEPTPSGSVAVDIKFAHEKTNLLTTGLMPLPTSDLHNGVNTLYRVKLEAGNGLGVQETRFVFKMSEGTYVSDLAIKDEVSGVVLGKGEVVNGEIHLYFQSPFIMATGTTRTFTLTAMVTGATPGSYVVTKMVDIKCIDYQVGAEFNGTPPSEAATLFSF